MLARCARGPSLWWSACLNTRSLVSTESPGGKRPMRSRQSVMEETMQSVRAHIRGGPEVLMVERAPRPVAAPGEALVQVEAAAITPTELSWDETWVDASGRPRTPTIPSHEVAGHVIAIGQGVDDLSVGESVFGLVDFDRNGAAAEFVSVPARALAPAPRTVDALTAAAVSLARVSCRHGLLIDRGRHAAHRLIAA